MIDGEMMRDTAVVPKSSRKRTRLAYAGSERAEFSGHESANTLLHSCCTIGGEEENDWDDPDGDVQPVHVLQRGAEVERSSTSRRLRWWMRKRRKCRITAGAGKKASDRVEDGASCKVQTTASVVRIQIHRV